MTTPSPLDQIQPANPTPRTSVSQATAVEQARAEAEVKAAVVVAQQCPRDVQRALRDMEEVCRMPALAERAFFSFRRAGSVVSGPSIHIARELARCWGNIDYGLRELRRDDIGGESEMMAFAWDLQTNTRSSSTFIVPHVRFSKGTRNPLEDPRDVYENNANAGARRVREAIFSVLPKWYTEAAKDIAHATITNGGGIPLQQRIKDMLAAFDRGGVTPAQLEGYVSRLSADWSEHDVAKLSVLFTSLRNGEISKEEAFGGSAQPAASIAAGTSAVTAADIMPAAEPEQPTSPARAELDKLADQVAARHDPAATPPAAGRQTPEVRRLLSNLQAAGITSVVPFLTQALGRPITSTEELTPADATEVNDNLDALVQDWITS